MIKTFFFSIVNLSAFSFVTNIALLSRQSSNENPGLIQWPFVGFRLQPPGPFVRLFFGPAELAATTRQRASRQLRLCGLHFLKPGFCSFRTPRRGNYKSLFIKCAIFYDTMVTANLISKNDVGIFETGERVTAEMEIRGRSEL